MLYYDLHLHSCLSPCADKDMTPNNICAMARLKGLDLIALTDHNTSGNLWAFEQTAKENGLLFLPGLEVCTAEEVHLLAYFPSVEQAGRMGDWCLKHLPPEKNRPEFFGRQVLMDAMDQEVGEEDALLIGALSQDLESVILQVRSLGGVTVPAHIHRSFGLLTVLGFLPGDPDFPTVEIKPGETLPEGRRGITSSDAHRLGDIAERLNTLPVAEKSVTAVLSWLAGGN